jgi:hypothetical protein
MPWVAGVFGNISSLSQTPPSIYFLDGWELTPPVEGGAITDSGTTGQDALDGAAVKFLRI